MRDRLAQALPFLDLRDYRPADLPRDVAAGLAVAVLAVPQAIAYALIAGLPPAAGLYAAALPAVIGGLFRSSRFVVAGPSNALSLLVGGGVAALAASSGAAPIDIAISVALVVGLLQVAAGVLRLGALVDYISNPVVLGYITGAAVLIAVGQLHNVSATPMSSGNLLTRMLSWLTGVGAFHPPTAMLALGTAAAVVLLRRLDRRIPTAVLAMAGGIGLGLVMDLPAAGIALISDLAPVPASLPDLTIPDLSRLHAIMPLAVAATVLSLVESSALARAIAAKTGQRINSSVEFTGQGLANIAAAFSGGYPVSGSLARSTLAWRAGARSRLGGVISGLIVLGVPLFAAPLVDRTPIASLAGLLLVLAWDLVDWTRIRLTLNGGLGDTAAFLVTLLGTWAFDLDKAIYLGVVISLVLFLRRARLITVRELAVDDRNRLREAASELTEADDEDEDEDDDLPVLSQGFRTCTNVRILHVEGSLFFGAASELQQILDHACADPQIHVLILRLKRCQGLDITTAEVLRSIGAKLKRDGRHLILVGMRPPVMERMVSFGLEAELGDDHLFPTEPGWFVAMDHAIRRALSLTQAHCPADDCPLEDYLALRAARRQQGTSGASTP